MEMLLADAFVGLIKLFLYAALPVFLVQASYAKMTGGRVDFQRFCHGCFRCLRSLLHSVFEGSKLIGDAAAKALPSKNTRLRFMVKQAVRLTISIVTIFILLLLCSRFSYVHQRPYEREMHCHLDD